MQPRRRDSRARTDRVAPPPSPETEPTTRELARVISGELDAVLVAGRYQVEGFLGRGGMATVYGAHDRVRDRAVALKVMHESLIGEPGMLARFGAEARVMTKLCSPHVVEIFDFGTTRSGVAYLAMERLEGEDLCTLLARERPLSWRRVRRLMLGVCAGLRAVHEAGIVHRDLKPSNCFCVRSPRGSELIKLLDFGVAQAPGQPSCERPADFIVGTPEYMSPEQTRGGPVDQRSDVYSAAILMGELLTNRRPFEADTPRATMKAHNEEPAPSLRALAGGRSLPPAFERIFARALSKHPQQRYADVASFERALVNASAPRWRPAQAPSRARPQAAFATHAP